MKLQSQLGQEEKAQISTVLKQEPFTKLSQRLAQESPELVPALLQLKTAIGEKNFEQYIEELNSLRRSNDVLLLITRNAMHRSIIEGRFKSDLVNCFNTPIIYIVNQ